LNGERDARRRLSVYRVDAFTERPFGGNPAGVAPDASGLSDEEMQKVAREMNLSETAFVTGRGTEDAFDVRFFTPEAEVDLCGHATVATFHLLWELGEIGLDGAAATVAQRTKAGLLEVELRRRESASPLVFMEHAKPKRLGSLDSGEAAELASLLGADGDDLGTARSAPADAAVEAVEAPIEIWYTGLADLIVPVASRGALDSLSPDSAGLAAFCRERGIISVHAFTFDVGEEPVDAICRDFSPAVGVPEDPVTGTASGALGAYLAANGLIGPGSDTVGLSLGQGHAVGRPGTVEVEVEVRDGMPARVRVGGAAVTVVEGEMRW